jgi:hypothetical protein
MPNPTEAGRRVAWFEDGELWCAEDATPPVSPAGWYLRPRGAVVAWIGPFATAEAAAAAPDGGDPFAAARRQLAAWARDGSGGASIVAAAVGSGRGQPRPTPTPTPAPASGSSAPAAEEDAGVPPPRPACLSPHPGRGEAARLDSGRAAADVDGQPAGSPRVPAPELGLPRRERERAGGTSRPPSEVPTAPRQLALAFGPDGGGVPAPSDDRGSPRSARRRRPSKRRGRAPPAGQEALPF